MTYDIYTRVSTAQALAGGSTAPSDKSYKLSASPGPGGTVVVRDVGVGQPMRFRVVIDTAPDIDTTFQVIVATDEALSASVIVVGSSGELLVDDLVAGREFDVDIGPITSAMLAANGEAHLGMRYVPKGAGTYGAGNVTAFIPLGDSPGVPHRYAGNYTGP